MDELQDFYDTAFPILEKSTDYLKSVSLDDISDEDTNLLRIFESLVTVSFPIEVWRQQRVPESGAAVFNAVVEPARSEEHTSELQSLMRISYAVFCLKNK